MPDTEEHLQRLARLAVSGDTDALNAIWADAIHDARRVCRRLRDYEQEDGIQTCLIELWRSILPNWRDHGYEGELRRLWRAAFRCVAISFLRHRATQCRGGHKRFVDVDEVDLPDAGVADPADIIADEEQAQVTLTRIMDASRSSPIAFQAIPMLAAGQSVPEVAAKLNVTPSCIYGCIRTIRRQLYPDPAPTVIEQVDATGDVIATHASINAASRATGIATTCIRRCLSGVAKLGRGFGWRYAKVGCRPPTIQINLTEIRWRR